MLTKPKNPKINWAHPLTRGLQMDFLLSEGGGNNPRELVVGSRLTNNNNDWYREFGDVGLRFDSSGEYSRITNLPPRQQFTRFLTIEVEFSRDSGGAGTVYGTLMGLGQNTTFGGRIWLLENDNGSGGWGQTLQVWWNSQPGIWSIPYPAAGKKHHLVVMYDGGSTSNVPIFILNGVRQTVTSRLGASGSLRTGGSTFALGNNAEAGGTWDGNVYRARVWNRMLSLREALELYRNPFQIYQNTNVIWKATASADVTKTVSELTATASLPAPAKGIQHSPNTLSVATQVLTPQVLLNTTFQAPVLAATTSIASVVSQILLMPSTGAVSASIPSSVGTLIAKEISTQSATAALPATATTILKQLTELSATATAISPTVSASASPTVSAPVLTATATLQTPEGAITKDIAVLVTTALAQDVTSLATKEVASLVATAQAELPSILATQNITITTPVLSAIATISDSEVVLSGRSIADSIVYDTDFNAPDSIIGDLVFSAVYDEDLATTSPDSNDISDEIVYDDTMPS